MNPIWRVTMEMSKSRSENQKLSKKRREMMKDKTRKEKEKRRAEALERDRQRYIVGQEQSHEDGDKDEPFEEIQESAAEKFQKELCWCIQQTQLGLASLKPASNEAKSQAEEGQRLLRILTSSKAPMAKKRQVMRATFGDYRSKMQQEERKHKADMSKRMCLEPVSPSKQGSSTFYRVSKATPLPNPPTQAAPPSNDPTGSACQGSSGVNPGLEELSPRTGRLEAERTDKSMEELEQNTKDMHIAGSPQNEAGEETSGNNKASGRPQAQKDRAKKGAESGGGSQSKPAGSVTSSDETAKPSSLALNQAQPFAFNFDIRDRDLDSRWRGSNRSIDGAHRALDSSLSENSTPEKGPSSGSGRRKTNSRRRSRAKKKQLSLIKDKEAAVAASNQEAVTVGNQDIPAADDQQVDNQATVLDNQKLQQEADRDFKFNFPEPAEQAVVP